MSVSTSVRPAGRRGEKGAGGGGGATACSTRNTAGLGAAKQNAYKAISRDSFVVKSYGSQIKQANGGVVRPGRQRHGVQCCGEEMSGNERYMPFRAAWLPTSCGLRSAAFSQRRVIVTPHTDGMGHESEPRKCYGYHNHWQPLNGSRQTTMNQAISRNA